MTITSSVADDLRRLGWDPGFSSSKMGEVRGAEIVTQMVFSTVGLYAPTEESGISLGDIMRAPQRSARPLRVAWPGYEYLVGAHVSAFVRPVERLDLQRFSDSTELRALLYATLHKLLGGGAHRVGLVVALPVEVLQDKAEAQRVERAMSGWLLGRHEFTVDGVAAAVEISQVRARVAQPVATWFDWGMDHTGQWIRGAEALRAPTLIIDQGYNTLDVLSVQGGQVNVRHTSGETLGMRRAAERLSELLARRHGLDLDLRSADAMIRRVVNGQKAETYVAGEPVDVTAEARQALSALAADVVAFVERAVGRGRQFRVLLTGGGALALAARLLQLYPHATVMPDPVLANARGLAKLAVRPGFLG